MAWSVATNKRMRNEGRGFEHRTHVYTSFQQYLGPISRHADGPRDIHALDYPYAGLVIEVVDAAEPSMFDALDAWLTGTYLPAAQRQTAAIAHSLRFRPRQLPKVFSDVGDVAGVERRITLVHFLDVAPDGVWDDFAGHGAAVEASGLGRLELCAPFIPTVPGTDLYVEES